MFLFTAVSSIVALIEGVEYIAATLGPIITGAINLAVVVVAFSVGGIAINETWAAIKKHYNQKEQGKVILHDVNTDHVAKIATAALIKNVIEKKHKQTGETNIKVTKEDLSLSKPENMLIVNRIYAEHTGNKPDTEEDKKLLELLKSKKLE